MTFRDQAASAISATALLLAAAPAVPAFAQSGGDTTSAGNDAPQSYREHAVRVGTDEHWEGVQDRGYRAQRSRPGFEVRSENDLTVYERRDLDRQGRAAQRARGARLPQSPTPATAVKPKTARQAFAEVFQRNTTRAKSSPDLRRSPAYREHAARVATDRNWRGVEDRGVRAQRSRPGFAVRSPDDLTARERYDLDRSGRAAQRARGVRLPTKKIVGSQSYGQRNFYPGQAGARRGGRTPPGFRQGRSSRAANSAFKVMRNAGNADLAAEMVGGRDVGVTRYGADMTVGQVSNAWRGGDPIASAAHSTRRFGRNMERGLIGIGESVRDPRRIPGNTARALEGTGRAAVDTTRWVGETAVNGTRNTARFMTDRRYANRQLRKADQGVRNAGKSLCKGASYFIPGLSKKKCK